MKPNLCANAPAGGVEWSDDDKAKLAQMMKQLFSVEDKEQLRKATEDVFSSGTGNGIYQTHCGQDGPSIKRIDPREFSQRTDMTTEKATVDGLLDLVCDFGEARADLMIACQAVCNEKMAQAGKKHCESFAAVVAYAKRLATQSSEVKT